MSLASSVNARNGVKAGSASLIYAEISGNLADVSGADAPNISNQDPSVTATKRRTNASTPLADCEVEESRTVSDLGFLLDVLQNSSSVPVKNNQSFCDW
ncbi:hypothetical protein [Mesorhizobium sp. M0571]|uniref:hypothetical protein n=1 Tax=Mesorhizobium sp. M0571 TaxID=2956960 RepID=UPI00333CC5A7